MKFITIKNNGSRKQLIIFGIKFSWKTKKTQATFNAKKTNNAIKKFNRVGVIQTQNKLKLIVSLTSFPERIEEVSYVIYSLLNQTLKPNMVILWLGEEQFPRKEKDLPEILLKLKKNGLTIKWCDDIKSYTKLIPTLKEYPNDIIVTADDDVYYPKNWLELLYNSYKKEPNFIHCHRAHKITFKKKQMQPYEKWISSISNVNPSYLNFFTGVGGVLYPPNSLYKDVTDNKLFTNLAPTTDDVWFWAMALLNDTKINVVENNITFINCINPDREYGGLKDGTCLHKINTGNNKNGENIEKIIKLYPQLLNKREIYDEMNIM